MSTQSKELLPVLGIITVAMGLILTIAFLGARWDSNSRMENCKAHGGVKVVYGHKGATGGVPSVCVDSNGRVVN